MEVLPPEVWVDILGWVDGAADVVRFGLTCRAANALATDPSLWRTLCPRLLFPSCAGQVRRAVEAQAGVERAKVDWRQLWIEHRRPSLRCAVFGAVDSGKSVLLAKLALHLGVVTPADLESARQECSNFGWSAPGADYVRLSEQLPRAFKSADHDAYYVPMETDHTRLAMILTNHHSHGSLQDAAVIDCALLVVSAAPGELEAGYFYTAKVLQQLQDAGKRVVVAVNKLDLFEDPARRWDEALAMLMRVWRTTCHDCFVPVSAKSEANLWAGSPGFGWFKGPTLLEAVQRLPLPRPGSAEALELQAEARAQESRRQGPCGAVILNSHIRPYDKSFLVLVALGVLRKDSTFVMTTTSDQTASGPVTFSSITDIHDRERPFALPGEVVQLRLSAPISLAADLDDSTGFAFVEK